LRARVDDLHAMRTVVVGGGGYYGARVVDVLRTIDGLDVAVASRSATCRVDLNDPATFEALSDFALVVNCSDSVGAPPDAAITFCRDRGVAWMDMGADPVLVQRLLAFPEEFAPLIVGVGIFPGISTCMAAAVGAGARRVEVGVRLSPLSGAGAANVDLMCHSLTTPGVFWENGHSVAGPSVGPPLPFEFLGGQGVAARIALPDAALVYHRTKAPFVSAHMALIPAFLRANLTLSAALLRVLGPFQRVALGLFRLSLWLLRSVLLARVSSSVEITVIADRSEPSERQLAAAFGDGQMATAMGVAAAVLAFMRARPSKGILLMPDLCTVDELWVLLEQLGSDVRYE
jgi:hypothetical protein